MVVLVEIMYHGFLTRLDLSVNLFMPVLRNAFLTLLSKGIDILFDTLPVLCVSLILAVYLWLRHVKKEALFFACIMLITAGAISVLKIVIQRARPLNAIIPATGFAFPSGHATTAVVFFGLLTYLIIRLKISTCIKIVTIIISACMILLIACTRIYLGVHWLTDVIGGLALGTCILSAGIMLQERFNIC